MSSRDTEPPSSDDPLVSVERTEWESGRARTETDTVAREEPLEIRLGGVPLAVVMRTPGHDEELARGFLVTERVVDDLTAIRSVRHCTTAEAPEAEGNVIQVVLGPDVEVDLARLRRNLYASSSCGICGKATIENALATASPIEDQSRMALWVLYTLPDRLRESQEVFTHTGGLHAAGLFDLEGRALVVREDIGRHNAVDKVIGWAAADRGSLSLGGCALMVSGRVSYEIVQKALAARIPIVAAVSAPSSLAIELAREANLTLVGFLRGQRLCIYAGDRRIVSP